MVPWCCFWLDETRRSAGEAFYFWRSKESIAGEAIITRLSSPHFTYDLCLDHSNLSPFQYYLQLQLTGSHHSSGQTYQYTDKHPHTDKHSYTDTRSHPQTTNTDSADPRGATNHPPLPSGTTKPRKKSSIMRYAKNLPAQAVVPQETNGRAGMEGASPAPVDSSTPSSRETTPACQDAGTTSMFGSLGRVWNSVVQTSKHRLLFSWGTNPNLTAQEANPNKVKVIKSEPANPNDPNL